MVRTGRKVALCGESPEPRDASGGGKGRREVQEAGVATAPGPVGRKTAGTGKQRSCRIWAGTDAEAREQA